MNNNRTRTIGIIIAVILGLAALLYLGGLVCQMLTEYQVWLAKGGMQGQAQIGDIRFGPLSCWRQALTMSGLKYTGLVALIGGSVYAFVRLYDRFGSHDFDDRNFARSQRGTYGTAGWMGETELRAVLEVASPQKARGIILGQSDRGSVICLPEDTRLNKHIAVFGASGTMKSRGVIRPALFQSIRRGESVVVTDPKSEIYSDTVELFRKHGYTVRVYNLLQPELSDSWNCMFDLGGDTLMAQVLTDVIIANTKGTNSAQIFADVRTYWSPEAVKKATGYDIEGVAKEAGGFIHLINSGAACLDACGQAKDADGNGVMKPWYEVTEEDQEAILKATTWNAADFGYFRGGGYSSRFVTEAEMPVTMIRLNLVKGLGPMLQIAEGWTVKLPEEVTDVLWKRTDYTWPCTWFAPRTTGEGAFKTAYDVMNNWGANHGAISYGHIGADLITMCSMLRIPVAMHNIPEEKIFRPAAWNAFGMDKEGQDFRACQTYGPLYK